MNSVTAILAELVSFKSISKTANLDIVEYLDRHFKGLGFDTMRIMSPDEPKRANLLCKIGPDADGGLMLSGHMDVVPVAGQTWDSDPFVLTQKEQKLIGRGSADMKGFIAATCIALKTTSFTKLKKPLTLLWTYDEEIGCTGSAVAAPLLKQYVHNVPKAALIGEPTDFAILRMHSGHVTVTIKVQGKGAHSSDPDLGISAIKAAHQVLTGIFAVEQELKSETSLIDYFKRPFVSLNVGEIHGGSAVNIVPDEVIISLGFRPLPKVPVENIFERIMTSCHRFLEDKRAIITGSIEKITPAMITNPGSDLEAILKPLAKNNESVAAQFSTDAGNLSQHGIECLIFGPGTIDVAHQANEWILERDLELAVGKVTTIVDQWFS
jgi:acetylornithine deacetylase